MIYYIKNINLNFIIEVCIHCRYVYLSTWLYIESIRNILQPDA